MAVQRNHPAKPSWGRMRGPSPWPRSLGKLDHRSDALARNRAIRMALASWLRGNR